MALFASPSKNQPFFNGLIKRLLTADGFAGSEELSLL